MKRRVLNHVKLDAIAAVDRPCQEHAIAQIIKRESDDMNITKKEHDDAIAALETKHKAAIDALQATHKSELEAVTKSVDSIKTDLAVAKLSDDERACYGEMDDEKKKKFLAASPAERAAQVTVAKAADESITIGNVTIRKSKVGAEVFASIKASEDARRESDARIAKAEENALVAKLEKRASEDFGKVVGTASLKAKVLRHMEKADPETKAAFEAIMKSTQDMIEKGFERVGSRGGNDPSIRKGQNDFNAEVTKIMKRDECSRSDALIKAAQEQPDLYKAYQEAGLQAQAAA